MICECGNHAWAPLTRGYVTLVDVTDVGYLARNWCALSGDYPYAFSNGFLLHREIAGAKHKELVDHRNGWCGDNRRVNLRTATRKQNAHNASGHGDSSSGVKGVSRHLNKWRATIRVNGRQVHLGLFADKHEAGRAYSAAATKHFGEFARIGASTREAAE